MEGKHLSETDVHALRRGGLTPEEIAAAGRHLAVCATCAAAAARTIPVDVEIAADDAHPPIDELFAYVDGNVRHERRRAIEAHLAFCRICREDVDDARAEQRSLARHAHGTPWLAIAAALVVAALVGVFAVWLTRKHAAAPVPAAAAMRSVAVIPLENVSSDRSDDFLSVALADALTTRLEQVPSLLVPPMSAVIEARKDDRGVTTDGVIKGDFAVTGGVVRVKLRLIDARNGSTVWTATVETRRDDLLALVATISDRTLAAVGRGAVRSSMPHSSNPEAFREYLQARALRDSFVPAENVAQIAHLKRAIELDPKFAAAYADLSLAITMERVRNETVALSPADAERFARNAVTFDPDFALGHLALARAIVRIPGRFREAIREEATALRLNAKDTATVALLASYVSARGDRARLHCLMRYLQRLDPTSSEVRLRGYWFLDALDAGGTMTAASSALASPSTALAGADLAANAALLRGDLGQAERFAAQASTLAPDNYLGPSLIAMIAAARGDANAAHAALARFEPAAMTNHFAAMRQALCYARLGDRKNAVLWTQRSEALGNHYWYFWSHHPWLQSLQQDPEFAAAVGKMRADLDGVQADMTEAADRICPM